VEELLEKPVIIELDQELPKPLRIFMSDIILRWIHLYRLGQGETDDLRHVTFLEEAHNLFPKSLAERQSSNSLENVFREIRGFGEGLVTITQHPSLIPIYILGNCNTQIYLGLQHEDDVMTAKRALFLEHRDEAFLDRLAVGEGIVKIKGRVGPCLVKFPLVPIKKGAIADDFAPPGSEGDGEAGLD
jgi:DNA helicase HerA-like ATPase